MLYYALYKYVKQPDDESCKLLYDTYDDYSTAMFNFARFAGLHLQEGYEMTFSQPDEFPKVVEMINYETNEEIAIVLEEEFD